MISFRFSRKLQIIKLKREVDFLSLSTGLRELMEHSLIGRAAVSKTVSIGSSPIVPVSGISYLNNIDRQ